MVARPRVSGYAKGDEQEPADMHHRLRDTRFKLTLIVAFCDDIHSPYIILLSITPLLTLALLLTLLLSAVM